MEVGIKAMGRGQIGQCLERRALLAGRARNAQESSGVAYERRGVERRERGLFGVAGCVHNYPFGELARAARLLTLAV